MLHYMRKLFEKIWERYGRQITAAALAALVTLSAYFLNNCPYPFWDALDMFSFCEDGIRLVLDKHEDRSDVLFVNVGYDKDVIDYCVNECDTGRVDITDRRKLIEFLELAEETDSYKCIFLDIRFEKGYDTPEDSLLFSKILNMRDVYCSHHSDITIAADSLLKRAIVNDYFTTITKTNFTRYQMIQDGKKSIPVVLDSLLNHSSMTKHGPFYRYNGHLCQNSPFLPIKDKISLTRGDGKIADYMDLGSFYLGFGRGMFEEDAKDRIVIVGDFINDWHDTYAGLQPGSYLVYLAYKTLASGRHVVPWGFTVLYFILYFNLFMGVLGRKSPVSLMKIDKRVHSKFVLFLLSFVSYGVVLTIASGILYMVFGIINNIFLPTIVITILQNILELVDQEGQKKLKVEE